MMLLLEPILTFAPCDSMGAVTMTTAGLSPATAAVNWAKEETVVVLPPFPPVVPPFSVAYPVVGVSVTEARLASTPRFSSTVGVGAARAIVERPSETKEENLMVQNDEEGREERIKESSQRMKEQTVLVKKKPFSW